MKNQYEDNADRPKIKNLENEIASIKSNLDELKRQSRNEEQEQNNVCLLYTSDAADERSSVDLGGRRIIKKKKKIEKRRVRNGNKRKLENTYEENKRR